MPQYGTQGVVSITAIAGVDLSAKQFRFGTIASDGQVDPTNDAAADGVILGWSVPPTAAGMPFTLAVQGVVPVEAGAAVTIGDQVAADSVGRAITAVQSDQMLGKALATASGAGSIIPVLLTLSQENTKA